MRSDRPSPPRHDYAPESYDPYDGPWEKYQGPPRYYTIGDCLLFGCFANFCGLMARSSPLGLLSPWYVASAVEMAFVAVGLIVGAWFIRRIRGA